MSETKEYVCIYYMYRVHDEIVVVDRIHTPKGILYNIYAKYGWKACTVAEQVTAWIADNFTVITAATRNCNHYVQAHLTGMDNNDIM